MQLVNGFMLLFGCADVVGATGDGQVPGKVSRRYPILVVGSSPLYTAGVSRRRNDQGSVAGRSGSSVLKRRREP